MAHYIIQDLCTACKVCTEVCMSGAVLDLNDEFHINPLWCTDCGACEAMCGEKAIVMEGLGHDPMDQSARKFQELNWYTVLHPEEEMLVL